MLFKTNYRWFARLLAVVFGMAIGLLLVELAGRALGLLPADPPNSFYEARALVGRLPEPYELFVHQFGSDLSNVVRFNYRSLRDVDHEYAKPNGVIRALVLGDSFSAGWQMPLEQTYVGRWRSWLGDQPYEVINAAYPNWGTDRQTLFYEIEARKYAPDIVVLQVYVGNDLVDNGVAALQSRRENSGFIVTPRELEESLPYFRLDQNGELVYTAPRSLPLTSSERIGGVRSWLFRNSVVYRMSSLFFESLGASSSPLPISSEKFNTFIPLEFDAFSPAFDQDPAWQETKFITRLLLQRLRRQVETDGARLVVLLADSIWMMDKLRWEKLQQAYGFPEDWTPNRMGDWWRSTLDEMEIPFVDTLPPLLDYADRSAQPILYPLDGHWTPQGHCVVGLAIAGWLHKQAAWPAMPTDPLQECLP